MKRPRIALWIKWHGGAAHEGVRLRLWGRWLCPNWLWRWAVRRVDRWHEEREDPKFTTLTGKLHRDVESIEQALLMIVAAAGPLGDLRDIIRDESEVQDQEDEPEADGE